MSSYLILRNEIEREGHYILLGEFEYKQRAEDIFKALEKLDPSKRYVLVLVQIIKDTEDLGE